MCANIARHRRARNGNRVKIDEVIKFRIAVEICAQHLQISVRVDIRRLGTEIRIVFGDKRAVWETERLLTLLAFTRVPCIFNPARDRVVVIALVIGIVVRQVRKRLD